LETSGGCFAKYLDCGALVMRRDNERILGLGVQMALITKAVGTRQPNIHQDVKTVQELLNKNICFLIPMDKLLVNGEFNPSTEELISFFQFRVLKVADPDGIIMPNGPTLRALNNHWRLPAKNTSAGNVAIPFACFVEAASKLACEAAAIEAVVKTEVGIRGPFDSNGRPTILFERHVFDRLTNGKFRISNPTLSNPVAGGYGHFSEQYTKLDAAMKLDASAALQSASWGAFQIMGENYEEAGFASVENFVAAMKQSVNKQMDAFVCFIENDPPLNKALQLKDWVTFARKYNGAGYTKNQYDIKMKHNYEESTRG
jgi:hypothetical protein